MSPPLPRSRWAAASEDGIVLLAINGDNEAYGELVRRRQQSLRMMLRRLCRNPALADDLAQQALLQGWQSIRHLQSAAAFGAWLRKLAVNCWLQHVRGRREEATVDAAEDADSPAPRIVEQLDLDAALARLGFEVRLCLVLAYCEGLSHAEISEQADLPLGTVKSHIARGAERLRTLLDGYEGTP